MFPLLSVVLALWLFSSGAATRVMRPGSEYMPREALNETAPYENLDKFGELLEVGPNVVGVRRTCCWGGDTRSVLFLKPRTSR